MHYRSSQFVFAMKEDGHEMTIYFVRGEDGEPVDANKLENYFPSERVDGHYLILNKFVPLRNDFFNVVAVAESKEDIPDRIEYCKRKAARKIRAEERVFIQKGSHPYTFTVEDEVRTRTITDEDEISELERIASSRPGGGIFETPYCGYCHPMNP